MGSQEKANILKTLPPLAFSTPATNATYHWTRLLHYKFRNLKRLCLMMNKHRGCRRIHKSCELKVYTNGVQMKINTFFKKRMCNKDVIYKRRTDVNMRKNYYTDSIIWKYAAIHLVFSNVRKNPWGETESPIIIITNL